MNNGKLAHAETTDVERSLRACLRDLVALSTMPAWWIGSSPREISDSVADMLASMLRADTVYVQLRDAETGEFLVGAVGATRGEVEAALKGLGKRGMMSALLPTFTGAPIRLVRMPIGLDGELGSVVVGSRRVDFPNELESLLLRVAVNQVSVAVEHATLLARQRNAERVAEHRADMQAAGVRFGMAALASVSVDRLFDSAVRVIGDTLHTDYSSILELSADGNFLHLRAGVGWRTGAVGHARVRNAARSYAAYTLRASEPVVVRDYRSDARFAGSSLFMRHPVVSCMSVVIGNQSGPIGVLGAGMRSDRTFTRDDAQFLQSIANLLAVAVLRSRAEKEVAESLRRASAAQLEAEKASQSKSDFIAMMSHDLRTPLNAIAGYSQLLELGIHGPLTQEQRTDVASIQRGQQYVMRLIDNVLTYMKLGSGKVTFRATEIAVEEMLIRIDELIRPQMDLKGLQYTQHCNCSGTLVRADGDRLQQIVLNLLSNSAKFTEAGGSVQLVCSADAHSVKLEVRDSGCGIPADKLDKAFEPYVQVDRTFSRPAEGTGLGLAISRALARAMNGELVAQSIVGTGSQFTVTLPRAEQSVS